MTNGNSILMASEERKADTLIRVGSVVSNIASVAEIGAVGREEGFNLACGSGEGGLSGNDREGNDEV